MEEKGKRVQLQAGDGSLRMRSKWMEQMGMGTAVLSEVFGPLPVSDAKPLSGRRRLTVQKWFGARQRASSADRRRGSG